MEAKLTLSMDAEVIKRAKEFAKNNQTSLSQLIENYFSNLTNKELKPQKDNISSTVKSLSGILHLPKNFDHKKDREEYLRKKYK
jgi:hypothetical protein